MVTVQEVSPKFLFAIDKRLLAEIKEKEARLKEKQREEFELQVDLKYLKSQLEIPWQTAIKYCLELGTGEHIIKTPKQVSDCIATYCEFEVSRDMKNNVATTLSTMYHQGYLGRTTMSGKTYYGLSKYFDAVSGCFSIFKSEYRKQIGI